MRIALRRFLKWLVRNIGVWLVALVIAAATACVVARLAHSYPSDPSTRWAAIAAVFTGAALLAALIGLPVAVTQLFAVHRDLSRLTRANEIEQRLGAYRLLGLRLLEPTDPSVWLTDHQRWIDKGVEMIGEIFDETEANAFRLIPLPATGDPKDHLRARIDYIQTVLIPSVRVRHRTDG